ncbi:MAG: IMPACT family protein [Intrasporangium sp.]|uniref:IMPACT family protein n=1 Tax=Intrasporangium sp. TaxID=1925024 RepID=UPI00264A4616|nr:YigZ family protein [Intrasporangium sp.]MDN5797732.1 IMPACT family protein [Intrasporangium sp.]
MDESARVTTDGSPASYLTIAGPVRAEVVTKRSRFVCDLEPASSEQAARTVIEQVRAGSREAGHHCTAFVLGPDRGLQRSNDDGEPSGTAGMPMLEVLRGAGVTDVVTVVTRWFGGVLLETGGLIRAYGDAVHAALETATAARYELSVILATSVPHADGPRLENALRTRGGLRVVDVEYAAHGVTVRVAVAPDGVAAAGSMLAELTGGTARFEPVGREWVRIGA